MTKGLETFQYRRPWYLLVLILLAAIVSTLAVVQTVSARRAEIAAQADSFQRLALQRLSLRVDDFIGNAAQLARAAANGPCSLRRDRALVRQLLEGLVAARLQAGIFGAGCFFEPRAFDGHSIYFGPYSHVAKSGMVFLDNADGSYKYHAFPWYRAAASSHGTLVPYGPYFDGQARFYSFLKAFYSNGKLAGVASVDTKERTLQLLAEPERGDYVYILTSYGLRTLTAGAAPDLGLPTVDMAVPVKFSRATLHLVSGRTKTVAAMSRALVNGALVVCAIWVVAAVMALTLLRSWRMKREQIALQIDQVRLENEIALRREVEAGLRKAAYGDILTGLPNRAFVLQNLTELLAEPAHAAGLLVLIDIDAFSMINDTLGHESGDALLVALAARLRDALPGEIVARLAGDEFVILSRGADDATVLTNRIQETMKAPFTFQNRDLHLTASLGLVYVDGAYAAAGDVLKDAEIAMYSSKRQGRNSSSVFNAGMRRQVELDAELASDLRRAIDGDEFTIEYQPIVDLATRAIVSLEALVRWNRPGHGLVLPGDFIPYAEVHGMVSGIDSLVMRHVCADLPALLAIAPNISMAVNCSMAQLTSSDIVRVTMESLREFDLPPSSLKLEITETSIMRNAAYALESLESLRALGVLTVVDDFGTGYSSLAYLQRLPIVGVKIDRSFITPLDQSAQALAIVRSITLLAQTLGLYTVAEGIETDLQLAKLRDVGCTFGQGYLFYRPLLLSKVAEVLSERAPVAP